MRNARIFSGAAIITLKEHGWGKCAFFFLTDLFVGIPIYRSVGQLISL